MCRVTAARPVGHSRRLVQSPPAPGIQVARARLRPRALVRGLQDPARRLCHLRTAPGRGDHFLSDCGHQTSSALRHRHGHRQPARSGFTADLAADRGSEFPYPQRSCRRQLAIPVHFRHDTAFTRTNAKGSRDDAQSELGKDLLCGDPPKTFNPANYSTKPWKISLAVHDGFKINLGAGHVLEIIATPGHTPDAICLLDRPNGLLFTGDTYYPAPIWLYRPETDLDAYVTSVKRIAALQPQVKVVLGAHNVPVADPSVLPRLLAAIEAVRAGKGDVKAEGEGKSVHTIDGFSFLMKASGGG